MNKPLPEDTKVSLARLCAAAEKLLRETERLRRDVAALNNRIPPIEDEGASSAWIEEPPVDRKSWKAVDALNLIAGACTNILNCEHELSAIRARIDATESAAIPREEIKAWIKQSS